MERRKIDYKTLDEVIADVEQLHRAGYEKAGQWDLEKICSHLSEFGRQSMDGYKNKGPWLLRTLAGKLILRHVLKVRSMPGGYYREH